jgi:putative ABC transport system ATP-binding protein
VWLAGRDITRWPVHRRAALVGRVFQDPFAGTAPDLSVAENMVLAAQRGRRRGPARAVGRSRRAVLREDLARLGLGLEDRLDTPVGLLSGGQRQAVTVLMATQSAPSLLLLDEHTAALDPRSGDQIVALTREIVASRHITTLMVTHVMAQAVQLGDRILLMHRGRIVHDLSGPARATLREPDLLQMFDELAWAGRLDTGTAAMLERSWI